MLDESTESDEMKKKLAAATITSMVLSIAGSAGTIIPGAGNDAFAAPYRSPPPPPPPVYRAPPPPPYRAPAPPPYRAPSPPYRAPSPPPYRAPSPPPYKAPDRTYQRQQENRRTDTYRDQQNRTTNDSIRKQQQQQERYKKDLDKRSK